MAVRYMGSKKSLAPEISDIITRNNPYATVLDVFAGMCAVGTEVTTRHKLFTNDIHIYASTFASALFTGEASGPTSLSARSELLKDFRANAAALEIAVRHRLRKEDEVLSQGSYDGRWRSGLEFANRELSRIPARRLKGLSGIEEYRADPKLFPYCLATSYFSSAYFGIRQSIEIDSLRYAIDRAPLRHRDRYLAALIDAASHCATAPGHFAQFLIPRDKPTFKYITRIRLRSVIGRFFEALDRFPRLNCHSRRHNKVFNREATQLLLEKRSYFARQNLVIYADPPYSRAQYSRYYHLLETIVRYDYPACHSKGRYRENRHQTDFSRKAHVADAMSQFSRAAAATGAKLYLSYPQNGLLSVAGVDVRDVLRQDFSTVTTIARKPIQHSTMGGASGRASHSVLEDVYYAAN